MSPLRILVLVILFYIGYRLIAGGRKKDSGKVESDKKSRVMPSSDILEEDPICKKLVPRQQAEQLDYNGNVYYFCSKKCCEEFRALHRKK